MKRAGAILSFFVAVFLLGAALYNVIHESSLEERVETLQEDMKTGDTQATDRQIQEDREKDHLVMFEGVAGSAFLIAGFVLVSGKRSNHTVDAARESEYQQ